MHEVLDDAELVLTELMSNAIVHANVPGIGRLIETRYEPTKDGLLLEVVDPDGEHYPRLRPVVAGEPGSRGLHLVDALTDHRWGMNGRDIGPGKVVWALVGNHDFRRDPS